MPFLDKTRVRFIYFHQLYICLASNLQISEKIAIFKM